MQELLKSIIGAGPELINNADLSVNFDKIDKNFIGYYTAQPSKEHYKLLAYVSKLLNNVHILDVGTFLGYSAIALSQNPTNKVISYDINKQHKQSDTHNTFYRIGDAREYEDFGSVKLILLDTYHDGSYEKLFIDHLRSIQWSGILLMDDLHEYKQLKAIYDVLPEEKYDITHLGHWSGTGLVVFKG